MEDAEDEVTPDRATPGPAAFERPEHRTVETWVDGAIAGDPAALDNLIRGIHPLVVRYCRSRLSDGHRSLSTADDVAQEVCMAICSALPTYRRDGRQFLAFVYGIAAHKVVDAHRAGGRSKSVPVAELPEDVTDEPGPESFAMAGATATLMDGLLSRLPQNQQEILRLRVAVGLSAEETAQVLEMSPGAVRVAQHRALTKLRSLLADDTDLREQLT
jgi:RNA polymerase sigma-70 factor (ECF subfamily)